ncbi:MAG: hypothetical protein ABIK97_05770 [candidate division WOR-3 bacterium]
MEDIIEGVIRGLTEGLIGGVIPSRIGKVREGVMGDIIGRGFPRVVSFVIRSKRDLNNYGVRLIF